MRSMSRCSVLGTTLGLTTTRQAHADVIKDAMKAADAIDKAFKRAEQIFSKYTVD